MIKRGISAVLALGAFFTFAFAQTAHAGVTGFVAGRIIDDAVFTNTSSMSAADIQRFLESKVPVCDTNGTQMYNSYQTRAQFAATLSTPQYPPFTCLKDYSENGSTAAQVIYNTAQTYNINPQVLIVLLQKEQGLVTDTWPYATQYQKATGYGCPDTAACNSLYYGFTNQVTRAANMFRKILDNSPTWYTPYVLGDNYIQYSPNTACGGSVVNIVNRSTQALYNYTPYQPNQATLDAGWGTASCGAYGNRNFYLYFTSWFGPTLTSSYDYQPLGQAVFTDASKTKLIGWNAEAIAGERVYVQFVVRNSGTQTWTHDMSTPQVRLGTWSPNDRNSPVCDSTWIRCNRLATFIEDSVAPGQSATFEFWATMPSSSRAYGESFNLVAEGFAWMQSKGIYMQFNSLAKIYSWQALGQAVYTDSSKQTLIGWNADILAGQRAYATITVKNTGNVPWSKTQGPQVRLGTWSPNDRNSPVCDSTWIRCNRLATHTEDVVQPGQMATFEFWLQAPTTPATYGESLNLVAEGVTWMKPTGLYLAVKSSPATYSWQPLGQANYTDNTKQALIGWNAAATAGAKVYSVVTVKNTGNVPWSKTQGPQVRLGTWSPNDRASSACDITWIRCNRLATHTEDVVQPGQMATFEFWANVPKVSGRVTGESLNLVAEGVTWMKPTGLFIAYSAL